MSTVLVGVALAFVLPSRAGVVVAPELGGSLGGLGAAPAISAAPLSAPSLPALALSPLLVAPSVDGEKPRLMLPTAVPVLPEFPAALAAAALKSAAPISARAEKPSLEKSQQEAAALFDGGRAATPGEGWTLGAFEGDGGTPILYKSRPGVGNAPARVYAGGLALNESFEPLFARAEKPAGDELFVWTRGHAPSNWSETKSPIDADARDLAIEPRSVSTEQDERGTILP